MLYSHGIRGAMLRHAHPLHKEPRHAHVQHDSRRRGSREERNRQARAALLQEYGNIECVPLARRAIRRRLSSAADAVGRRLEFRRIPDAVYFWAAEGWRRGRPRKNPID